MIEMAAPVKKAIYRLTTIRGNPNKNPKTKDNLTSPNPIPRPLVKANKAKKKPLHASAEIIWLVREKP